MLRGWQPRLAVWASLAFVLAFCAGLTPALHLHVSSHADRGHLACDCTYCEVILTGATVIADDPGPVVTNEDLWHFTGGLVLAAPVPDHVYEPAAPRGPPSR